MTAQEQVAKLEALLARVNGRRGAPRKPAEAVAAAPVEARASAVPAPEPRASAVLQPAAQAAAKPAAAERSPAPPAVAAPAAAAPAPTPLAPRVAPVAPVTPTPAAAPPPAPSATVAVTKTARKDSAPDLDVEVEEGMAEVDLDGIDEASGDPLGDSVADLDAVPGVQKDDVPSSSRRPLRVEPPLEDVGFTEGAEAKAPHPPPPESGRQVAIPTAAGVEDELQRSGVRAMPDVVPAAAVAAGPLKADVTKPVIAAASPAVFHGALPSTPPATFGELLDATLGL